MFYAKLSEICRQKNIKISHLMKEVGLSASAASDWKRRNAKPKIENIKKIAEYLNVPEEILTEESSQTIKDNSNSIIGNQNTGNNTITVHSQGEITDEFEKELISEYRSLNIKNKRKLFDYIDTLKENESN